MKKIIQVDPIFDEKLNCVELVVASASQWANTDYYSLFSSSWGFNYFPLNLEQDKLGNRLFHNSIPMRDNFNAMKKHGLFIEFNENSSTEQFLELANQELTNHNPLGMFVDAYWCPWVPSYQKQHNHHSILITGIDQSNNIFFCRDTMFSKNIEVLPFKYFNKSNEKMSLTFKKMNVENELWHSDWRDTIEKSLLSFYKQTNGGNIFHNMREFSKDILERVDLVFEEKDELLVPLVIRKLSEISNGRHNYSKLIYVLSDLYHDQDLLYFSQCLTEAHKRWKFIQVLMTKCILTKDHTRLISISEHILDASQYEEQISKEFLHYLKFSH